VVEKTGPGVTRFAPGDRVASNTTGVLRNDHRFGAYQQFTLVPQELTSKVEATTYLILCSFLTWQIADTPFEEAASLSTIYAPISALFFHLKLDRPTSTPPIPKNEKVLIWGVSSSFGASSAQLAQQAGYTVVGIASGRHANLAKEFGVSHFVDRASAEAVQDLVALGPYKTVLAAADSAEDQVKIGQILAAQGGGHFLSTMGVRAGVKLPDGVTGSFQQFLDDFLDPTNKEFTEWAWWKYLEGAYADHSLKSLPLEIKDGLSAVTEAWSLLREGKVSGKRLIVLPNSE
jgi:NADPH:quinone reductase-like Zn-dependent oxidoreductase